MNSDYDLHVSCTQQQSEHEKTYYCLLILGHKNYVNKVNEGKKLQIYSEDKSKHTVYKVFQKAKSVILFEAMIVNDKISENGLDPLCYFISKMHLM